MVAGQRLIADDGHEVALFPMPYLYMSQDEGGDYSHLNTYNIDFLGYDANGRVFQAPIYAPCTMKVVEFWNSEQGGHQVTFESVDKVWLPNGQLDYLTIAFGHDSNPPYTTIGQVVTQGDLCYHTGTYGNVTGDHVHTCAGQGQYQGYTTRTGGHMDLTNRIHYWDAVFTNDTVILQGYHHIWREYQAPPTPTSVSKKGRFPWVLYARKLRKKQLY